MESKLIAPNENYEIANCKNCGKEYIKRKGNSTKQLSPGIRGCRMKNCSKKCTMESKHKASNAGSSDSDVEV